MRRPLLRRRVMLFYAGERLLHFGEKPTRNGDRMGGDRLLRTSRSGHDAPRSGSCWSWMCFLLISTEFLTASAGVGSWYGNAKPTPCGSGELAVISGVLALFRIPEPAWPKNRYARFWRAAYLRMSDTSYDRPLSGERFESFSMRSVQIRAHDCVRSRSALLA